MRDEVFIRGNVPMTKSEVRAVVISKLELFPGAVAYDIGSGTGSVAVEMSAAVGQGRVYAVERKGEAVELIRQNAEKFGAGNLRIIEGKAPECLKDLEIPTHAFIGGSSGKLKEIIQLLLDKNSDVRIVISAIALETLSQAAALLKELKLDSEIVCVQVSKANPVGSYHMMQAMNPVYIISFGGKA